MERKYDLSRLKNAVRITDVLARFDLDAKLLVRDGELVGPCPLPDHKGDRNNRGAFRVRLSSGLWHCHTHCGGGDIVELVALMEGGNYAAAARALAQLEVGAQTAVPHHPRAGQKAPPRNAFSPYTKRLRLIPDHPWVRDRGIRPRTAQTFEAGWWPLRGFLEGCIGVRLHDPHGRPLGYAGRRVAPGQVRRFGKWKLPRDLPKGDMLFNWHRSLQRLRQGLIVVEGPFDAMRIWQAGFRSVVALLGARPTASQQALLASAPRIIVALDGDAAGRDGARAIARKLSPMSVRVVDLPEGRDPADLAEEDIRRIFAFLSP